MTGVREILGVDIGGVIIERKPEGDDTAFFSARYLETPEVAGAIDAIAQLAKGRFAGRVHLVSKCGETVETHTREWLEHHEFAKRTGLNPERMHFCRTRPEKAPIAKRLSITHFIDDRLEVLGYLQNVPNRILFRPDEMEISGKDALLEFVTRVEGWAEVLALLPR